MSNPSTSDNQYTFAAMVETINFPWPAPPAIPDIIYIAAVYVVNLDDRERLMQQYEAFMGEDETPFPILLHRFLPRGLSIFERKDGAKCIVKLYEDGGWTKPDSDFSPKFRAWIDCPTRFKSLLEQSLERKR